MDKEDKGQHDIIARRDEGTFLVIFWGYHRFDHTNEAVIQE